jgi:hypothetical protein
VAVQTQAVTLAAMLVETQAATLVETQAVMLVARLLPQVETQAATLVARLLPQVELPRPQVELPRPQVELPRPLVAPARPRRPSAGFSRTELQLADRQRLFADRLHRLQRMVLSSMELMSSPSQ